jgi:acetyl esterase
MPLHPSYVERFPLLEGIDSFEQLMSDPALEERFHAFIQWRDAAPPPDVVAVVRWVREHHADLAVDPDRIAVGGASAGANLATGAVLRLRDQDGWLPAVLVPAYGVFHPVLPEVSAEVRELMSQVPDLLRFTPEQTAGITANYLGNPPDSADGYAMPALADLTGLCPVLMVDAEYDDLRASEEPFADALVAARVSVRRHLVPGAMHGFLNLPPEVEPVGQAFQLIADVVATPSPVLTS